MSKTKEEQEEYDQAQAQCKYLIETARAHPDIWKIITIYNGEKHFIRGVGDDTIWIIDEFKEEYQLNFLLKESIEAIKEITS